MFFSHIHLCSGWIGKRNFYRSHFSVSTSQPKTNFQKESFSHLLSVSSNFQSVSLSKSQSQQTLCFKPQAYPCTSSQARASNSPTERNCTATHNSDAPLLFWLRTALRRKFILSLEHVQ